LLQRFVQESNERQTELQRVRVRVPRTAADLHELDVHVSTDHSVVRFVLRRYDQ
jgi:hypothetical protein